jgi:hypothetical protein
MNLNYVVPLSPDESMAVYLAKQVDGSLREVVVKFPLTYNTRAHRLLADHGLAPEVIYDGTEGPCYGGLLMIVMDYVKRARTLSKFLYSSPHQGRLDAVITSVRKAIALLYAENLVFGDLRIGRGESFYNHGHLFSTFADFFYMVNLYDLLGRSPILNGLYMRRYSTLGPNAQPSPCPLQGMSLATAPP